MPRAAYLQSRVLRLLQTSTRREKLESSKHGMSRTGRASTSSVVPKITGSTKLAMLKCRKNCARKAADTLPVPSGRCRHREPLVAPEGPLLKMTGLNDPFPARAMSGFMHCDFGVGFRFSNGQKLCKTPKLGSPSAWYKVLRSSSSEMTQGTMETHWQSNWKKKCHCSYAGRVETLKS